MLIFEQLVGRGFVVLDPQRNVQTFNRDVVAGVPALRKSKMERFSWFVGEWAAGNRVHAHHSRF